MNNEYYVYLHRRVTDNKVFYVGKGKNKRAYSRSGRNDRWNKTYAKHGLIVEIVFDNLTETEAFEIEVDTIKEMRYHFEDTLCNMTDGGEGLSGYKWTNMENHPSRNNIGRKQSKEEIERRVAKMKGRKVSEETRLKISKSNITTKACEVVFSRMVRILSGRCQLIARDFNRLPDIRREDFYVERDYLGGWSKTAVARSVEVRKGKPAHNGDKTVYCFININSAEEFNGTRRDLAVKIDSDNMHSVIKQVSRVVLGVRISAYGWKLKKDDNGTS